MHTPKLEHVAQHLPAMQALALKFTNDHDCAKDLVQDTMLKAMKFYTTYESGTNMRGWLSTIMRNTFINGFKRNVMVISLITQSDALNYQQLMWSSTMNGSENNFLGKDIRRALSILPHKLYIPFMRFTEGHKYHEIAKESNVPIGTIRTRIYQARQILRKQLADYDPNLTQVILK